MARKPGANPSAIRNRAAKTAAAMAAPSTLAPAKKKTSLPQFAKEVRAEARKITWTTRRETWITSVMVAIMVIMAVIFFALVDGGISFGINQILRLASTGS